MWLLWTLKNHPYCYYLPLLWLMLAFLLTRLWNGRFNDLKKNTSVCMSVANCYVHDMVITMKLALQKSSPSLSVTTVPFKQVLCCYGLLPHIAKYCNWKHLCDYRTCVEAMCGGIMSTEVLECDFIAVLDIQMRTSSLSKAEQSKSSSVEFCSCHAQKLPNVNYYCQVCYMTGSRKYFWCF